MIHPLSMLFEKGDPREQPRFSMTRLVALMFAATVCWAIVLYAKGAHDLTWPFATVAIVTLLAVPLQALCKYLQQWLSTSPGQAVLASLAEKLTGKIEAKVDGHEHEGDR